MMPICIKDHCHRCSRTSRVCPGRIFLWRSILCWIELAQAHEALSCVVLRNMLTLRCCGGSISIKRDKTPQCRMWKQVIHDEKAQNENGNQANHHNNPGNGLIRLSSSKVTF